MRLTFYLLTIASCGVLAGIFCSRQQWGGVVLVLTVAGLYVVRGAVLGRKDAVERRRAGEELLSRTHTTSREKREVLDRLLQTRERARMSRLRAVFLGFLVMIGVVLAYPQNVPLAFAMSVFLLPLMYLILKNTQAINEITQGLRSGT